MNAPVDHAAFNSPEKTRAYLAELAWLIGVQSDVANQYAVIGDDAGATYAWRKIAAYTRQGLDALADLHAVAAEPAPRSRIMEGAR